MILSAIGHFRHSFRLHRHAIKQNNSKPFSKETQEIIML